MKSLLASFGIAAVTAWLMRPRDPRITSVRSLVRIPLDVNGLETDGTNVYYAEVGRPTSRLMTIPLAGGAPREIPLPWRGALPGYVFLRQPWRWLARPRLVPIQRSRST